MTDTDPNAPSRIFIWDLPVRVMHWSFLLLVVGAWATRKLPGEWFVWHVRIGYAIFILTATRIVWGVLGTRYARFAEFVRGPQSVLQYLRGAAQRHYAGHNPAGGWMVLLLLLLLLAQAVTGLFANDQISETGPLFGYITVDRSDFLTSLHKIGFKILQAAVALHIVAVLFHLFVRRENLVRPMLDGAKSVDLVPQGAVGINGSQAMRALAVAAIWGVALWWVVRSAPEASLFAF